MGYSLIKDRNDVGFGELLMCIGDINNDGYEDIGVPLGEKKISYIILGGFLPGDYSISELSNKHIIELRGTDIRKISRIGDMNGDGIIDFSIHYSNPVLIAVVFGADN
jgi:hypothetical protein